MWGGPGDRIGCKQNGCWDVMGGGMTVRDVGLTPCIWLAWWGEEWAKDAAALKAEWQELRRGWYLGDEGFKAQLLEKVGAVMSGRKRESYTGLAAEAHDEQRAEVLLQRGLTALRISVAEAQALPQNDLRKQGLAWLVRTATVVTGDWVRARLCMGHRSNVSRAVQRLQAGKAEVAEIRAILQPCKD